MRKVICAGLLVLMLAGISCADPVDDLLSYYVGKFGIEKGEIFVDALPDSTGHFSDIYMKLTGLMIENFRVNEITVRMRDVQFNEPSEWAKGNVECKSAISIQSIASIRENDVNKAIKDRTFGDDGSEWHDMSMEIKPSGLSGRGYYRFGFLDILIEATSKFKIVKGKEIWLKDPQVKINRMDLPDYVTRKALADIQPILDLNRFPLPMTLHKVELKQGVATLSTRTLPKPIKAGLRYTYPK